MISRITCNYYTISIGYDNGSIRIFGNNRGKYEFNYVFNVQTDMILYLVYDPLEEFLYASSRDKSYAIYSIKLLKCVKLYADCYDIIGTMNASLDYLSIVNICPQSHGFITCYLTNNSVLFYQRYNHKVKYKVEVFKTNQYLCLCRVTFLKDGHLFITSTHDFNFYIYDFIRLKIVFRLELYSYLPVKTFIVSRQEIIHFLNAKNEIILTCDLNKFL